MRKVIDDGFIAMLEARDLRIQNPMDGMFGGNRRSAAYGSSAEFADFRDYTPATICAGSTGICTPGLKS